MQMYALVIMHSVTYTCSDVVDAWFQDMENSYVTMYLYIIMYTMVPFKDSD